MVKSLYTGVSGLKTHQQKMDVIGNNIANVNTTGYKTYVTTFSDIYYQTKKYPTAATGTLGGTNPMQVGYGVQMNTTTANMSQSGFTYSDNIYDMALDGEGFFQVMDGAGNIFYTRAGVFNVDESGYLVNAEGMHVLGISGDSVGQPADSQVIRINIPETKANCSSATKEIAGTNVTISVSAPSDNTDMSVTFTNSEYPYATFANGVLNIFFNMDEQYTSDDLFEAEITEALNAGGVELPDGVELKFEFESVPDDPHAKIASNSIIGWGAETTVPSGEAIYRDPASPTNEVVGILGFKAVRAKLEGELDIAVNVDYPDTSITEMVEVSFTAGDATTDPVTLPTWTIKAKEGVTAKDINDALRAFAENNPAAPEITCSRFVMEAATRDAALRDIATTNIILHAGKSEVSLDATANVEGEYANNYKITFAYSSSYGKTKAVWDENNLTITVCNDSTQDDINAAIKAAAAGDEKRIINITGMADSIGGTKVVQQYDTTDPANPKPLYWTDAAHTGTQATDAGFGFATKETVVGSKMNAADREAFFGSNPALSLMGGKDSFFTEVGKSLTTFNLNNGRVGDIQTYQSLENVTIQADGTIIGVHPVHGYMNLARIDIATFDNPNGLTSIGGTMFAESVASGAAKVCIAGQDGAGEVVAGALEMSNVDLAQEFTDMISTQRGYQANSRVVTTSDTMLEELLNLKR